MTLVRTETTWTTRTIYYKYVMWGIKLKGFVRQVDLSYSQGYDDTFKDGNDMDDKDNMDNMNDKDNLS